MNADLTDKLVTLNKLLQCAVMYNENATILKDGKITITHTVNVYADVRDLGFTAPVLVSSPNAQNVVDVVDSLIEKLKEKKNG